MKKIWRFFRGLLAFVLVSLLAAEVFSAISVETGMIPAPVPNYTVPSTKPFWADLNADFGVWHAPNTSDVHQSRCFRASYRTNAFGMRDPERTLQSDKPRTLVLGDSFVEGFGLERGQRTTDLLEQRTGIEHLNYGTSGSFGTVQEMLLYKTLASNFDHDRVVWTVLPNNDFDDNSPEFGRTAFADRYRPYAVSDGAGGYAIEYWQQDKLNAWGRSDKEMRKQRLRAFRHLLTNFSYAANVVRYMERLTSYRMAQDKPLAGAQASGQSGYWDYREDDLVRLFWSIEEGLKIAGSRPVDIVLIPVEGDLERLAREGAPAPLSQSFSAFAARHDQVRVLDLLPVFAGQQDAQRLYHDCDGHWSPEGAAFVADTLRPWLYPRP
ncbi:hypothetical protein ACFL12_07405 [Pseudomonadota bacterium]